MIKDNTKFGGVATDIDGKYSFSFPSGSVLSVSSIGYDEVTKLCRRSETWNVTLSESMEMLEDVVVIGYGVQKKESLVGSIAQVESEALINSGTTNVTNALAGKLSGVLTYTSSGQPGEDDATILIRGISSWNGSSPLVMVDGVERTFSDLNPNEIQSISVLKDASATAVFGAKGANGVILVTTKTGGVGRPKMSVNLSYGMSTPMTLPEHVSSYEVIQMANLAYRNGRSFASQYSDDVLTTYKNQTNPYRYPNVNWYDEILRDFANSINASMNVSGGTDRVKYYISLSYADDGSIVKTVNDFGKSSFGYKKINFRSNIDVKATKTTTLAFKVSGIVDFKTGLSSMNTANLFGTMFMATGALYPSYYPEEALALYPDPDYPDYKGWRVSGNQGSAFDNPYSYLVIPDYKTSSMTKLATDLHISQKLDFITKGLSLTGKLSITTAYTRLAEQTVTSIPKWDIDWNLVDLNKGDNPWISSNRQTYVYVNPPVKTVHDASATAIAYIFYAEAGLRYSRKFAGKHNVSALALYNQRDYRYGAAFPKRQQAIVGRITYDYKGIYLVEANVGYTGSEKFAPQNRFGVFPSVAAGYVISKERFWRRSMPWWSMMKIRYSQGIVGSDAANSANLYHSSYSKSSIGIKEDAAANETARWETANKKDLGIEMGWFKNALSLNIDLWDEQRKDMLMTPVLTPMVGVNYKDINGGAMKKHGVDIELEYRNHFKNGFHYSIGGMIGLNENRITKYGDAPFSPVYQKTTGKPYASATTGLELVDGKYFTTIDEIHAYPTFSSSWLSVYPGVYKYLDYSSDGKLSNDDLHVIKGSQYAPTVYSFNIGVGYKGFQFNMLLYGNYGKMVNFNRAFVRAFISDDLVAHKAQKDWWTPTNSDASSSVPAFNDSMYTWAGGSSSWDGFRIKIPGYTWRKSNYLTVKEVKLSYTFDSDKLKKNTGLNALGVYVTANNLFTFTNLIEGDPQLTDFLSVYYPVMRMVKFGVNMNF